MNPVLAVGQIIVSIALIVADPAAGPRHGPVRHVRRRLGGLSQPARHRAPALAVHDRPDRPVRPVLAGRRSSSRRRRSEPSCPRPPTPRRISSDHELGPTAPSSPASSSVLVAHRASRSAARPSRPRAATARAQPTRAADAAPYARASSAAPIDVSPLRRPHPGRPRPRRARVPGPRPLGPDGTLDRRRPRRALDDVDPTGATWTFHLRPDARWQDGEPVTADDVVFTVDTSSDPDYTGPGAGSWREVTATAVDARTVRFDLDDAARRVPPGSRPSRSRRRTCSATSPLGRAGQRPVRPAPGRLRPVRGRRARPRPRRPRAGRSTVAAPSPAAERGTPRPDRPARDDHGRRRARRAPSRTSPGSSSASSTTPPTCDGLPGRRARRRLRPRSPPTPPPSPTAPGARLVRYPPTTPDAVAPEPPRRRTPSSATRRSASRSSQAIDRDAHRRPPSSAGWRRAPTRSIPPTLVGVRRHRQRRRARSTRRRPPQALKAAGWTQADGRLAPEGREEAASTLELLVPEERRTRSLFAVAAQSRRDWTGDRALDRHRRRSDPASSLADRLAHGRVRGGGPRRSPSASTRTSTRSSPRPRRGPAARTSRAPGSGPRQAPRRGPRAGRRRGPQGRLRRPPEAPRGGDYVLPLALRGRVRRAPRHGPGTRSSSRRRPVDRFWDVLTWRLADGR